MTERHGAGTAEKQEAVPEKYKPIETGFIQLTAEGQNVFGVLIEKGTIRFGENVVGRYKLQQESGTVITVLGTTVLDDLLEQVPEGTDLSITYQGTRDSKAGRKVRQYQIGIAE